MTDKNVSIIIRAKNEATAVINKVSDGFSALKANLLAVTAAITAIVAAFYKTMKAAIESEVVESKRNQALKKSGELTAENIKSLNTQADTIMRLLGIEDEEIKKVQTQLSYGKLRAEQIKQLTPLILDFAAASTEEGINAESAAKMVAKSIEGEVNVLSRIGIVFSENATKTEKFNTVMSEFTQRFGGAAQANVQGINKEIVAFKVATSELIETLGSYITQSEAAQSIIVGLTGSINATTEAIKKDDDISKDNIVTVGKQTIALDLLDKAFQKLGQTNLAVETQKQLRDAQKELEDYRKIVEKESERIAKVLALGVDAPSITESTPYKRMTELQKKVGELQRDLEKMMASPEASKALEIFIANMDAANTAITNTQNKTVELTEAQKNLATEYAKKAFEATATELEKIQKAEADALVAVGNNEAAKANIRAVFAAQRKALEDKMISDGIAIAERELEAVEATEAQKNEIRRRGIEARNALITQRMAQERAAYEEELSLVRQSTQEKINIAINAANQQLQILQQLKQQQQSLNDTTAREALLADNQSYIERSIAADDYMQKLVELENSLAAATQPEDVQNLIAEMERLKKITADTEIAPDLEEKFGELQKQIATAIEQLSNAKINIDVDTTNMLKFGKDAVDEIYNYAKKLTNIPVTFKVQSPNSDSINVD